MRLKVDGGIVTVFETQHETTVSPYTGRQLNTFEGVANASNKHQHEIIYGALNAAEPLVAIAEDESENGRWRSRVTQYSITNERYEYHVQLSEVEELSAERLILNEDFELEPYQYEESEALTGTGIIQINCRVRTSPDQTERLFELMGRKDYFPVVRVGVAAEPRMMRFGVCPWSRHPDPGYDKHELLLLDRAFDERPSPGRGDLFPDTTARARLAFEMEYLRGILDLLESKGVLTNEERKHAAETAGVKYIRRSFDFRQVDDIDEHEEQRPDGEESALSQNE
jgi:hypothetical protein